MESGKKAFKGSKIDSNMRIACGKEHMMVIKNGKLYGRGRNTFGQLGTGLNNDEHTEFVCIIRKTQTVHVACGAYHTMIIDEMGMLYGSGSNRYGNLGNEVLLERNNTFIHIDVDGKKVIHVSCGEFHTMVVTEDGMLYGAGSNWYGPLGNGTEIDVVSKFVPIDIDGKRIKQVACGYYHTMVITDDGTLVGAGKNGRCQLGKESSWKERKFIPIDIDGKKVKHVACGSGHTLAITEDDMLYGAGKNTYGQLANGQYGEKHTIDKSKFTLIDIGDKKIRSLVAWSINTMIITTDGMLFGAGRCYSFGFDRCQPRFVPINVHGKKIANVLDSMVVTEDNTLYYTNLRRVGCEFIPIMIND